MRRPPLLILSALLAAVPLRAAAPPLGGEIVISAEAAQEYAPAVAYNSLRDEYLVVWQDAFDVIYGQRVQASGQLLNRFVVSDSPNGKRQPAVAYDLIRDRYLVTWSYDYWGNGTDWDIFGRFIPWDGPSASLHDFSICDWTSQQRDPSLAHAWFQNEFLVVWVNESTGVSDYVSARRVAADGSGFPANPFLVSSGTAARRHPDVAYNQAHNEYLVAWDTGGVDIRGVRLSATGVVQGGGEIDIAGWPSVEERPSVASCPAADQYLVAWQSDQETGGTDWAIYARYLSGAGVPGNVYMIDDTTAPELNVDLSCGLAGTLYLLAWQTMYASSWYGVWARIAYPSELLPPQFGLVQPGPSHSRFEPAVAGGASTFLVAWEHETGFVAQRDIHGRTVILTLLSDGFESGNLNAWSALTSGCLGSGGTFDLPGPFGNVQECVDALMAAAVTTCCAGRLEPPPGVGFIYGTNPPLCRGICD